jgi:hypothetical protein
VPLVVEIVGNLGSSGSAPLPVDVYNMTTVALYGSHSDFGNDNVLYSLRGLASLRWNS